MYSVPLGRPALEPDIAGSAEPGIVSA
jgi:hypothetical protein